MRKLHDEINAKMKIGFHTICDSCGKSGLPDDEGLECECSGTFIIEY